MQKECMSNKIPVAILVRVSTLKQENDRQISELQAYADSKGYEVVEVCEEKISGNADGSERHGLHRVEELARGGAVEKVLVHEVSRLARRNSIAHGFIEILEELGVSLYCKRGKRGHLDSVQAARSRPADFLRAAAMRAGVSVAMTSGSVTPGRTVSSSLR